MDCSQWTRSQILTSVDYWIILHINSSWSCLQISAKILDRQYTSVGRHMNVIARIGSDIFNPVFDYRVEFREPNMAATSTLLIKVSFVYAVYFLALATDATLKQLHNQLNFSVSEKLQNCNNFWIINMERPGKINSISFVHQSLIIHICDGGKLNYLNVMMWIWKIVIWGIFEVYREMISRCRYRYQERNWIIVNSVCFLFGLIYLNIYFAYFLKVEINLCSMFI